MKTTKKNQAMQRHEEQKKMLMPDQAVNQLVEHVQAIVKKSNDLTVLDSSKESILAKILEFDSYWSEAMKIVKKQIDSEMALLDITAAKGAVVSISRYKSGPKYSVSDAAADGYKKITVSADSEKIDEFRDIHEGELPEGVGENERSYTLRISLRKQDDASV